MAATPEKKVKTAIKSWLTKQGIYFHCPIGSAFGTHGAPDIFCCAKGRFVGIECKAPGKEKNTTPNQDDHISRINAAGGLSFVASSLDEVVVQFTALGLL